MSDLQHVTTRDAPIDARSGVGSFLLTWVAAAFASSVALLTLHPHEGDVPIGVLAASLLTGWIVYSAGSWFASRRFGTGDIRSDLGVAVRPFDLVGIPIGVLCQLVAVPLVYVPLRRIWPATFSEQVLTETAGDLVDRADGGLVVVLFVLVAIGAPLFEELLYRGLLQRPLLAEFPASAVIVGVAAVFAVIHFRPVEYPGLFVAGLVFGVCAWWTGRLGTSVIVHVAFNTTGLLVAL